MGARLRTIEVTIADTGTAQQVSETSIEVTSAVIQAASDNAAAVTVHGDNDGTADTAGLFVTASGVLPLGGTPYKDEALVDLSKVWVKGTADDVVVVGYLE